MNILQNKVALVTGASRGVGKGIAEELGLAGATVYVTGRSRSEGNSTEGMPGTIEETAALVTEAGGNGIAVYCDHTNDNDVAELFKQIESEQAGQLDILVNNVWGGYERYDGATFIAPFWEQPRWRWDAMFATGPRAHYTAAQHAAPLMLQRNSGLIINISAGDRGLYLGAVPYDAAKGTVDRLAFGMAHDLADTGVTVLALYPGFVHTERVVQEYKGDLSITHSPRYVGRAVVALAMDPNVKAKSGGAFATGDIAKEYGFTDIDGRYIPAFRIDEAH